jgi:hypothetical protein
VDTETIINDISILSEKTNPDLNETKILFHDNKTNNKINNSSNNLEENKLSGQIHYGNKIKNSLQENYQKNNKFNLTKIDSKNFNKIVQSKFSCNVPVKLKMRINKNNQVEKIIKILKDMRDLELEESEGKINYTKLVILVNNKYINLNLKLDESFQNGQTISVYELINYDGLSKLFGFKSLKYSNFLLDRSAENNDLKTKKEINLKNNENKSLENPSNCLLLENEFYIPLEKSEFTCLNGFKPSEKIENKCFEFLIKIIHRIPNCKSAYLFDPLEYNSLPTFTDVALFVNLIQIKVSSLYNLIWEKCQYYLNNPEKFSNDLWWKKLKINFLNGVVNQNLNKNLINNQKCIPFVLKILRKENLSCARCPWFRFCSGCFLDPEENEFITMKHNYIIAADWCLSVYENDFIKSNLSLIINNAIYNDELRNEAAYSSEKSNLEKSNFKKVIFF